MPDAVQPQRIKLVHNKPDKRVARVDIPYEYLLALEVSVGLHHSELMSTPYSKRTKEWYATTELLLQIQADIKNLFE